MSPDRPLAAACVALLGLVLATPASALDLLDTYELARRHDAAFATARAEYRAAREVRPQARAAVLPQINLSGSLAENYPDRGDDYTSDQYELRLTQTLFDWADFAGLDRADALVAQAEAQLASAEQDLILRVAQAYFDVLTARDRVRFAEAEKDAIERQLEQARQRFEVGLIPITDVKSAQASHDLAAAREIEARNAVENAREALRTLIDRPPGVLASVTAELPLESPEPAVDAWVARALEQNPDYLSARAAAEAARHFMRVQRAGRYPTLDVFASHSETDRDDTTVTGTDFAVGGAEETDRIGLQLNWNLYTGGSVSSQTDEARALFQAEQSRLTQARRDTAQNTRNTYRNIEATVSQVRALGQAVESNQAALEAERAGFRVGTRTAVDVLTVLRDLYGAQRDYAEARYNYIVNRLNLKQAAGTLTVEDVRLVNGWLEEEDAAE